MKTQGFRLVQGAELPPRLPPSSRFSVWAKRSLIVGALYAVGFVVATIDGSGPVTAESPQLQMWRRLQLTFTDPQEHSPERKVAVLPETVRRIGESAIAAEAARMAAEDATIIAASKRADELATDPSFWNSAARMEAAVQEKKELDKILHRRAIRHANLSASIESLHVAALIERQQKSMAAAKESITQRMVDEARKLEKDAIGTPYDRAVVRSLVALFSPATFPLRILYTDGRSDNDENRCSEGQFACSADDRGSQVVGPSSPPTSVRAQVPDAGARVLLA